MEDPLEFGRKMFMATCHFSNALSSYYTGLSKYHNDFLDPFWISMSSFYSTEIEKVKKFSPQETFNDYIELLQFNLQVAKRGYDSSMQQMDEYHSRHFPEFLNALGNTITGTEGEDIETYSKRLSVLMNQLTYEYPAMIKAIKPQYGLHLDSPGYKLAMETESFYLYQVLPLDPGVETKQNGKPVIIIPPYVLGANILCLLPGENKSYVHAFANQGIPTYIRVMKDIHHIESVQNLTGEADALETRTMCEKVMAAHGRMVTLNGFCQGGYMSTLNILSGELDGLVDALITCVTPMDGTRSRALVEYLEHLPDRFRDLGYAVKEGENGNEIVDGKVMSWVYKLKSMDQEAPLVTFYRDLLMIEKSGMKLSPTAAALNYWLIYDRTDLPVEITQLSFKSYTIPVEKDGTLPVTMFGKKVNFKRLKEKNIKFLLCYAGSDELVDSAAALAPVDFIDTVEVTKFPKGHGSIATSWSNPKSECALHTVFDGQRGPVRFQMDLDMEK